MINLAFQLSLSYTSFTAAREPTPAVPDLAARREVPIPVAVPVATATGTQGRQIQIMNGNAKSQIQIGIQIDNPNG